MKHYAKTNKSDAGERGQELFKVINIRVFGEHNSGSQLFRYNARRGCGFSEGEVDKYLESVAGQIEKRFPNWEFELVQIGPASFNFVYRGNRLAPQCRSAATESREPASD